LDLTAVQYFWLVDHNDWSKWFAFSSPHVYAVLVTVLVLGLKKNTAKLKTFNFIIQSDILSTGGEAQRDALRIEMAESGSVLDCQSRVPHSASDVDSWGTSRQGRAGALSRISSYTNMLRIQGWLWKRTCYLPRLVSWKEIYMKDFGLKWQNRPLEFNRQSTVPNFRHCALARVDSWPSPSLLLLLLLHLFLLFCCFPERRASSPLYPTSLCSFADSALSHMCALDTMLWLEVFFWNIFSPVWVCVWSILFAGWSWGVREGKDVVVCEGSEGGRRLLLLTKVVEKMARSKTLPLGSSSSSWPRLLDPSYYLRRPRRLLLLLVLFVGTTFVLWDRHSLVQHHQVSFCFVFFPPFSSLLTWWSLCFLFAVYLCLSMLLLDSIAK
jgi:hypothetical protein